MSRLVAIQAELKTLVDRQMAFVAEQGETWSDEALSEANERKARMDELSAERKRLVAAADLAKAAETEYEFQTTPASNMVHPGGNAKAAGEMAASKTAGQSVIEHPDFQDWFHRVAPQGHFSEKKQFDSPSIPVPGGLKTLLTGLSTTSGGALVFPDIQSGVVPMPFRPLVMRDIITIGQTNSDTVEYVKVTGYTNAAAATAEATNTSTGTKPESAMALAKVTAPVRTIAHWIPATTRAMSDAPQLRTLIDAFLRDGLMQTLEDEILTGDGSGEHFDGVGHISGTQAQAYDTDLLTTMRKARTLVRVVGRDTPTAFVMHPNDWQTVDLLQDNEARYFFGGPRELQTPRVWGLPVVEAEACPQGTAYVGNWKTVVLFDREQASIQMSNSHASFFIQNLVAILAEMRAALAVLRPASIVAIDMTP